MKRLLTVFALSLLATASFGASTTANLLAMRAKTSAAVTSGVWQSNFTKAKNYADSKGLPFIAVWSNGDRCGHCTKFAGVANTIEFRTWMKSSGAVFFFAYYGDKSYPVGGSVFNWCRKNTTTAYPFVRIWWKKKGLDIATTGDTVDGRASTTAGAKNAISYFKSKLGSSPASVKSYTIVYNANGGTGTMASRKVNVGSTITLNANAFKRADCQFAGWALSATAAAKYSNNAKVKNLTTVNGRTVTLYAKWRRITYRTYYTGVKMSLAISGLKGYSLATKVAGLSWNSTKYTLSGTPTKAGTFTLTFKKGTKSTTRKVVIVKDQIVLANTSFSGTVIGENTEFSADISPSATSGALKSVSVSGLPAGMTYAGGVISGKSGKVGSFTVTISAVSAKGQKLTKTVTLTIGVPEKLVGTFNGFVGLGEDPEYTVTNRGTFRFTSSSAAKLSAKVVTAKGTYIFTGQGWVIEGGGVYSAVLTSSTGKDRLDVSIDVNSVGSDFELAGTFTPSYGTVYTAIAQRATAVPVKVVGTWYLIATKVGSSWVMSYGTSKSKNLTLKVTSDGTATLAGTIGSYTVSATSAALVFASDVEQGFVRADFPLPVTVSKVKKTLDLWLNLWFDKSNAHTTERDEGIGAAVIREFK